MEQRKNTLNEPLRKRQSYIIPKRNFLQKYPKTVVYVGTITGLLIFFSRPLYDAFIRDDITPIEPSKRTETILRAWRT